MKLLAEERSSSLIPYIENHDLYIAFQETKAYKVCVCVGECVGVCEYWLIMPRGEAVGGIL